jgi:gamma-glutamylcyclotransferase (GGCT)/AIG2-like uncharacterized protein YtfP
MTSPQDWWKQEAPNFLADVLAHINQSRRREEPVDRCDGLCKALNKTWNAHFVYRRRHDGLTDSEKAKGRSDAQAFAQLLLVGLDDGLAGSLCECESVKVLTAFSPQVMNHNTLMRRDYNPGTVTDDLRKEASDEHRELLNAFRRYVGGQKDRGARVALLKRLVQLLYVIRSNIAHSEKSPRGPDLAKNERDGAVSGVASAVIEDIFDLLLARPSHRLAVYGTLAPGEPNASVLADISGEWSDGTVRGELTKNEGLSRFRWREAGSEVGVKVLTSGDLPDHFPEIDKFEGKRYVRSLVPVACGSSLVVCNIYGAA